MNLWNGKSHVLESGRHFRPGYPYLRATPTVVNLLAAVVAAMVASCAVPVPPTGGPADEDPPTLISSLPKDGSVNQIVDRITFEFNERIDEASVRQAVSIIPEFDGRPDIRASGNRLTIDLPEAVRENTTYIVTLDSRLRDAHGVSLRQPITVAFGTGPDINKGMIRGRVLASKNGATLAGIDVFAYATGTEAGQDLERRPDYRTQTDDQGNFVFSYLSEQSYFVLALRDGNANRTVDSTEEMAIPPVRSILADSAGESIERPWVLSRIDSARPELLEVRGLSSRELEVRFSEPIIMKDTVATGWVVADSLSHAQMSVDLTYKGENPRDVILRTESLPNRSHYLTGSAAIVDSSGNAMITDTLYFTPSTAPLEGEVTFRGFTPDSLVESSQGTYRIWPETFAGVRFSAPPLALWQEMVRVADTSGTPIDVSPRTSNNVLFELFGSELPRPARVTVTHTDSTSDRLFVSADVSLLGDLGGVVSAAPEDGVVKVELLRDEPGQSVVYATVADADGTFTFTGLPGGTRYIVRAYVDENGDGRWSAGSADPYSKPEPIGWSIVEEPIRARWETVLPDTLSIIRN